jgi:hypothetical protein
MPTCTGFISPTGNGPAFSRSSHLLPSRARLRWGQFGVHRARAVYAARTVQPNWSTHGSSAQGSTSTVLGGEQFPVPLGDDFDGAVNHFDGGLVVDRIRRT